MKGKSISPDLTTEEIKVSSSYISSFDHLLSQITFTLLGFISLYPWNVVLNVVNDITFYIFKDESLADTIILLYETLNIAIVSYLTIKGGVRPKALEAACYFSCLVTLSFPCLVQFLGADDSTGRILMHLIFLPISLSIGLLLGLSFSISSIMPINYGGFVGFGQGVSGVGSFLFYLFSDRALFPRIEKGSPQGLQNLRNTAWLLFAIGSLVSIFVGILIRKLSSRSWFEESVSAYWNRLSISQNTSNFTNNYNNENESSPLDSPHTPLSIDEKTTLDSPRNYIPVTLQPTRPIRLILKDCWQQLFNSFFSLWVTLLLFPLIGPYGWVGSTQNDVHVGIFQFGDFIGRYIPLGGKYFRMKKNLIIYVACSRFFFIFLFTFAKVFSYSIFNTFWLQAIIMSIFSLSNGWIITQTMIYIPETVDRIKEKGRVGLYNILVLQLAVIIGLYSSKLYKTFLDAI